MVSDASTAPSPSGSSTSARWFERPGAWFWCALALGVAVRFALAWWSAGTTDVELWTQHASGVARQGLERYYKIAPEFNHPPPIAWAMARAWRLSSEWGLPFASVYRSFVALADVAALALLWRALRGHAARVPSVALYALSPLALALAGQHGNTDALLGAVLLACVVLAAGERAVLAGIVLGLSSWIKLPGLLAAPAIGFAFPRWRERCVCACVALAVAVVGFAPSYFAAQALAASSPGTIPEGVNVMVERVFGYQGWYVRTTSDPPTFVWGFKNFLFAGFGPDPRAWPSWARWWVDFSVLPTVDRSRTVALAAMFALAFLRRRQRTARELGVTVALSFVLFCGLVETWTFQYFAWGMAAWMLLRPSGVLLTHVVAGGYLYSVYAFVCGDWRLVATWDFLGHPHWPRWLTLWRDIANVALALLGLAALAVAFVGELRAWRGRSAQQRRGSPAA